MDTAKILIAEDDEALLNMIAFKLRGEGFSQIFHAYDGKRAKRVIQEEKPSVIITDILMPFASGLEVISYVRLELEYDPFIIALSAMNTPHAEAEAYDLGANYYLAKPFNLQGLIEQVKQVIPVVL
ncbi:MAG: response regulator [Tunicatimonas sp.]|uniref:response regulator transcription factor n=1 Tax=Tunicatimonas sp. TaxID=1940096 RepID=UPI003C73DBB1